jgi:TetR/AcrR family transcriptional regulator, repressor for neighboring sulfatase
VGVLNDPDPAARPRPSGRAAVMGAILDAATELFAERGPNAVTVRSIAERAGINHALVHRYFGTKEDLIGAVVGREQERFSRLVTTGGDPASTLGRIQVELAARRSYVRFLARAILDGYEPQRLQPGFPVLGSLLGLVSGSGVRPVTDDAAEDRRFALAAMASLALGWQIFGGYLTTGLTLDALPREQVDARIGAFITSVLLARPADPTPGTGGS